MRGPFQPTVCRTPHTAWRPHWLGRFRRHNRRRAGKFPESRRSGGRLPDTEFCHSGTRKSEWTRSCSVQSSPRYPCERSVLRTGRLRTRWPSVCIDGGSPQSGSPSYTRRMRSQSVSNPHIQLHHYITCRWRVAAVTPPVFPVECIY